MGQYRHHVLVCTSGKTCPDDIWYAGVDVTGAARILDEHPVGGNVVQDYLYVAPSGDNKAPTEGDPD